MFVLAPLLGGVSYFGITWAAGLFHRETLGTQFLVQPSPIDWLIPAILLGIGTWWIPLDWLYRALLRDRYRRYERYCIEQNGFDWRRLLVCLAVVLSAAAAVFFLAGVTSRTRFSDAGIEIQRPFSFRSVFYDYGRALPASRARRLRSRSTDELHASEVLIPVASGLRSPIVPQPATPPGAALAATPSGAQMRYNGPWPSPMFRSTGPSHSAYGSRRGPQQRAPTSSTPRRSRSPTRPATRSSSTRMRRSGPIRTSWSPASPRRCSPRILPAFRQ